jgi:hypothetical protein
MARSTPALDTSGHSSQSNQVWHMQQHNTNCSARGWRVRSAEERTGDARPCGRCKAMCAPRFLWAHTRARANMSAARGTTLRQRRLLVHRFIVRTSPRAMCSTYCKRSGTVRVARCALCLAVEPGSSAWRLDMCEEAQCLTLPRQAIHRHLARNLLTQASVLVGPNVFQQASRIRPTPLAPPAQATTRQGTAWTRAPTTGTLSDNAIVLSDGATATTTRERRMSYSATVSSISVCHLCLSVLSYCMFIRS